MKHIISLLLILATVLGLNAQVKVVVVGATSAPKSSQKKDDNKSLLRTSIKDATWKRDVEDAFVIPYDNDGNPLDTIKANGFKWNGSEVVKTSDVSVPVNQGDTSVVFDAGAPGYETITVHWTFKPLSKREVSRDMDPILLNKNRVLKEVTVTASKVKFYNKGDTIVYDADAFQLAEGSMLDALISQLPVAKIDENGRITVIGEFVETLLLNGKDLCNNEQSVMLENIPAYTVKNVQVYKGRTKEEKFTGDETTPRHLTMDVKLKKEYSNGWLINAQAGYGTSDRYLGRLFASWFSPTTSVVVTGLANNLNDNRTPGKSDSWTPESMPSGTMRTSEASIRYNHEKSDESLQANGALSVVGGSNDYSTSTSATNFLSGGDNYERRFSSSKSSRFSIRTWHSGYVSFHKVHRFGLDISGDYSKTDNYGDGLSATFTKDYADISKEALEAIYGNTSADVLKDIVNRSATLSEGSLRSGSFSVNPSVSFRLPGSSERISVRSHVAYTTSKRYSWNDYNINFGADPVPAERRRQYTDDSPNYKKEIGYSVSYSRPMRGAFLHMTYNYSFIDAAKDSYMYGLEKLEDMGIFGVLPTDYASALDPSNSYTSRTFTNYHNLQLSYSYTKSFEKSELMVGVMPQIGIEHTRFDYWRDNRSYLVKRTFFKMPRTFATIWLRFLFSKYDEGRYANTIQYQPSVYNQNPQLLHLVDVVNTSNPLSIEEGNPDLRDAYVQQHSLSWGFTPQDKPINNRLAFSAEIISDALVRGYVYNTQTGVRRYKTYNVSGNTNFVIVNSFNWQFGKQKQFSLGSGTKCDINNNTDMVGINLDTPTKAQVRNTELSQHLVLSYRIGKQTITVNGSASHRHTSSERPDFNTIDAQHYKYGVSGVFSLPAGFGISTDLNFYKRVGYGIDELDTTDAVWNMRLTYTPKGTRWTFMADGFDLLHKLSNVNYAVTATGRTVSYSNTLPRYFIVSVQYRLNIQPKK